MLVMFLSSHKSLAQDPLSLLTQRASTNIDRFGPASGMRANAAISQVAGNGTTKMRTMKICRAFESACLTGAQLARKHHILVCFSGAFCLREDPSAL